VLVAALSGLLVAVKSLGSRASRPPSVAVQLARWKQRYPGFDCAPGKETRYTVSYSCERSNGNTTSLGLVVFFKPDAPASIRSAVTGG
jgi:hypothetical protein